MGSGGRSGRRHLMAIGLGAAVLASACGSTNAQVGAEVATPAAETTVAQGSTPSRPSVRIEVPTSDDPDPGPPAIETTIPPPSTARSAASDEPTTAAPSSSSPSEGGTEPSSSVQAPTPTSSVPPTRIPPPTLDSGGGGAGAYSIVAQAVVPATVARSAPADDAPPIADFTNPTGSGAPLVFLAVDGGEASAEWIEVLLPVQPNGTTGWIKRNDVELTNNPYRLRIDRSKFQLQVFYRNDLWLESTVAIGTGATPTPVGDFYLLELLRPLQENSPYGPFAFGLSGFSEVLESFGGADAAIIGIHGTNDPSSIGSEVSHGCVRLDNAVIEQLASTLPLGTPVEIV